MRFSFRSKSIRQRKKDCLNSKNFLRINHLNDDTFSENIIFQGQIELKTWKEINCRFHDWRLNLTLYEIFWSIVEDEMRKIRKFIMNTPGKFIVCFICFKLHSIFEMQKKLFEHFFFFFAFLKDWCMSFVFCYYTFSIHGISYILRNITQTKKHHSKIIQQM